MTLSSAPYWCSVIGPDVPLDRAQTDSGLIIVTVIGGRSVPVVGRGLPVILAGPAVQVLWLLALAVAMLMRRRPASGPGGGDGGSGGGLIGPDLFSPV